MMRDYDRNYRPQRVGAEGNLEELPWAVVSSGSQSRDGIISYAWQEEYIDAQGLRRWTDHLWEVREARGLGLPGRMEQDVYVAVLELLECRGGMPDDRVLYFSLYELLKILGWPIGGVKYKRLKQALTCISSTTIQSHRAFYNPRVKKFVSDNFQLFTVHFEEAEDYAGRRLPDRNHIIFHPYFADSYRENYEGKIDAGFYWTLNSHLARRLYRLLDRRAAENPGGKARVWEADLLEVRDLIPLAQYSRRAKVKQILEGEAHKELLEKGFLSAITYRDEKEGRTKKILARYRLSSSFEKRTFTTKTDLSEVDDSAVRQLQSIGIKRKVGEELVILHGAQHCLYWFELLHYQDGIDWTRAPGLLVNAIRDEPERWEEVAKRKGRAAKASSSESSEQDFIQGEEDNDPEEIDAIGQNLDDECPDVMPDPAAQELWDKVLEEIAEEINAPSLRVWFEGTFATAVDEHSLTICVPNDFAKEYIEKRFKEIIEGALANHLSPASTLEIVIGTQKSTDNTSVREGSGKE